ncbi:MAG: transposase [Thiobacillus sp.]|nr:transposase [Thiobacillus sp.]
MLREVRAAVEPVLGLEHGRYWSIDDTGIPKQGTHSVAVTRRYCGVPRKTLASSLPRKREPSKINRLVDSRLRGNDGFFKVPCGQLGKAENCQEAISLSLASDIGSVPIQWRLYLPKEWTEDQSRYMTAAVPDDITFSTKRDLALAQVKQAKEDAPPWDRAGRSGLWGQRGKPVRRQDRQRLDRHVAALLAMTESISATLTPARVPDLANCRAGHKAGPPFVRSATRTSTPNH